MRAFWLQVALLAVVLLPAGGYAVELASLITSSGGNRVLNLDGGTVYTGGQFFTESATINGNGATIDLGGAGPTNNLGVSGQITLTLNDVTLRNGAGVLLFAGSTLDARGTTFHSTQKGVRADVGCTVNLTQCDFISQGEYTLDLSGGTAVLTDVNVLSGPQIVLFTGAHLTWNGGQFLGGSDYGLNVQASNPSSRVELSDVHFQGRAKTAINLTQFDVLRVERCSIQDCLRGIDLQFLGRTVFIEDLTIDGSGMSEAIRQDGILAREVDHVTIADVVITNMRSGIVALDVDDFTLRDSRLTGNLKNQLNVSFVASGLIENCFMKSARIREEINVEDFDICYTERSTVVIRNCVLVDSADNGIFSQASDFTMENCFIAGSRANGLQLRENLSAPQSPGSHFTVRDSTIINSQHQDIYVSRVCRLDAERVILGKTAKS